MLPPALARPESIYPLGGPNLAAARRWYARARVKPTTLVFYTTNRRRRVAQAQVLAFNLKQLGIDLEVKYFDTLPAREGRRPAASRSTSCLDGWAADYADGGSFFEPLLDGRTSRRPATCNVAYFDDPQTNARIERRTGSPARRAPQGLGRTSTST